MQGTVNNAMLTDDCRYRLAENEANDSITVPIGEQKKHDAKGAGQ